MILKIFIKVFTAIGYFLWLLKEITISTFKVCKIICSLKLRSKIKPKIQWVESVQRTDIGVTILSNSITLTPGTVTIDTANNKILIHQLYKSDISQMDQKVLKVLC